MSFLKKHWRFAVPAVVVLCVLLLGVIALYRTSEPPVPKTVYAMSERSGADAPPPLNTGRIATVETVPRSTTTGGTELPETEVANDTENLESCCPEESAQVGDISVLPSEGNMVHVSSEVIADAQRYQAWRQEYDEYRKREKGIEDKAEKWSKEIDMVADEFYATLSPADRASVRAGLPPEARHCYPSLFDDVTPARPPDPNMETRRQSLLSEGIALQNQIRQLNPPPAPLPQHSHKAD